MKYPRQWFTCTPMHFRGDQVFFARDSGLLCKGFQAIGIDCKAIMPGPAMETDQAEDLIRTEYRNLEDPDWWRALGGEGVVFYGWGSGKYLRIVQAIKLAGIFLVSHMDTAGILGVFNGPRDYIGNTWRTSIGEAENTAFGIIRFAVRLAYGYSIGILRNDFNRARHLAAANVVGAITPIAQERIKKVCRSYGGAELASRVHLIPHPNASYMSYNPEIKKERLLVAVGRWDDPKVKGTRLLMAVSERVLKLDPELAIEIYGRTHTELDSWHLSLPMAYRSRVKLLGVAPNTRVTNAMQRARISLCTSLREGYHTVSGEAHCCGCSVVGPDVPEIPSMKWFTSNGFGRVAARNPEAMAAAVIQELTDWDGGKRNALTISEYWTGLLHTQNVASRIVDLFLQSKDR